MGHPAFDLEFVIVVTVYILYILRRGALRRIIHHLDPSAEAFPKSEGVESR